MRSRFGVRNLVARGIVLLTLTGCGSGGIATPDSAPFEVATISPSPGRTEVSLSAPVHVVFTRSIDPSTLNQESLVVLSPDGRAVRGAVVFRSMTPATVSFVPTDSYDLGTEYEVRVTAAVRDVQGRSLPTSFASRFSTRRGSLSSAPTPGTSAPTPPAPPSGKSIFYEDDSGTAYEMDADSLVSRTISTRGHPSYELHGGRFWFLHVEESSQVLPSGNFATRLVATSRNGSSVTLVEATNNRDIGRGSPYRVRWAKDDSFVSFAAVTFAGKTLTGSLIRIAVNWPGDEPSTQGSAEEFIEDVGMESSGTGNARLYSHDWSPSGTKYLYELDNDKGQQGRVDTRDLVTGEFWNFGVNVGTPEWSPIGSDESAPIAFHHHPSGPRSGVRGGPEGAKQIPLYPWVPGGASYQKWAHDSTPAWSPDGSRVAFGSAEMGGGLAIVSADGLDFKVVFENTGNIRTLGWR